MEPLQPINGGQAGQFILTGSHQPGLHEAISQSLAGRTAMLTLWPFSVSELRHYKPSWSPFELIVRGCFPRLHEENLDSRRFYNGYIQTCVERDVRALIRLRDLTQFQQVLTLLAGRPKEGIRSTVPGSSSRGKKMSLYVKWINRAFDRVEICWYR